MFLEFGLKPLPEISTPTSAKKDPPKDPSSFCKSFSKRKLFRSGHCELGLGAITFYITSQWWILHEGRCHISWSIQAFRGRWSWLRFHGNPRGVLRFPVELSGLNFPWLSSLSEIFIWSFFEMSKPNLLSLFNVGKYNISDLKKNWNACPY